MIADLDETIKKLIREDLPIKNGEIEVSFDQPKREWSAKMTKPTINFFLFDVRENVQMRRSQFDPVGNGNLQQSIAKMKKAPHYIDCHYMLTTWATEGEDEHRLLTRTLMTLFRYPILPDHLLQGALQHPRSPIQALIARHDKLTNPAEVWSALDNEMRPSICYTVTMALDPWTEVSGPIVTTYTIRAGQASELPLYRKLDGDQPDMELNYIGGLVRAKGKDGEPKPGLEVAIKGRGWFDTTDENGRFVLGGMPAGDYTLVVWAEKGKPKEQAISVPAKEGKYEVEI